MCKCKLGTEPVNRLTREQCDRMINSLYTIYAKHYKGKRMRLIHRIQQYKDNLDKRNL